MDLLLEIREKYGTAILLVSHDLGVIARMCDRIAVMYRGRIVELAEAKDLYLSPQHPYTQLLLRSVPVPDPLHRPERSADGNDSAGVPLPLGQGCRYRGRCPEALPECVEQDPVLAEVRTGSHLVACIRRQEEAGRETQRNLDGEPEVVPTTFFPLSAETRAEARLAGEVSHRSKE